MGGPCSIPQWFEAVVLGCRPRTLLLKLKTRGLAFSWSLTATVIFPPALKADAAMRVGLWRRRGSARPPGPPAETRSGRLLAALGRRSDIPGEPVSVLDARPRLKRNKKRNKPRHEACRAFDPASPIRPVARHVRSNLLTRNESAASIEGYDRGIINDPHGRKSERSGDE
ncbi:hypothetical protein SKAU_G00106370 [Synaphobranchus kaupii]|uniref:Uncharacterized protein n=1 Tax=Synaphobranchus kaupii TaxID=118154 RepID=A0A9Q1J7M1_SYNKA|nr:hypothetical protein SKAU_G00106370 [Synaphobranchus kaupii]